MIHNEYNNNVFQQCDDIQISRSDYKIFTRKKSCDVGSGVGEKDRKNSMGKEKSKEIQKCGTIRSGTPGVSRLMRNVGYTGRSELLQPMAGLELQELMAAGIIG